MVDAADDVQHPPLGILLRRLDPGKLCLRLRGRNPATVHQLCFHSRGEVAAARWVLEGSQARVAPHCIRLPPPHQADRVGGPASPDEPLGPGASERVARHAFCPVRGVADAERPGRRDDRLRHGGFLDDQPLQRREEGEVEIGLASEMSMREGPLEPELLVEDRVDGAVRPHLTGWANATVEMVAPSAA